MPQVGHHPEAAESDDPRPTSDGHHPEAAESDDPTSTSDGHHPEAAESDDLSATRPEPPRRSDRPEPWVRSVPQPVQQSQDLRTPKPQGSPLQAAGGFRSA